MKQDRANEGDNLNIRSRLGKALAGNPVAIPVYAVYDWFVINRQIDWPRLFDLGLGRINHASLVDIERPHLKIVESVEHRDGREHRLTRWITDIGELQERHVDSWRQEHLIKAPQDYRIMRRALEDVRFTPTNMYFDQSEQTLGDSGITVGQFGRFGEMGYARTPFQVVQIDFTGLEQFSIDIAEQQPELLELLEMMDTQMLEAFRCAVTTRAVQIKLWENLSIETMGPVLFRQHLVPLYRKILAITNGAGKKLQVHYDGKLHVIAGEIGGLEFDGLDSLTPPPEGDLTIAEARRLLPDKFFWLHPSLSLHTLPDAELQARIRQLVVDAGNRFCLQLSEEVPPDWERTVPLILKTLEDK